MLEGLARASYLEVGEDHGGLFVGAAVVAASEQDDGWRELVRGGEEGAEVGVAGYDDSFSRR